MRAKGRTVQPDGEQIRALRINKGLSVEELAGQSNVSEKTIKSLEDGKDCFISTLRELGNVLGVEAQELLTGSPAIHPPVKGRTWTVTLQIKTSHEVFDETTDLLHLVKTLITRLGLGDIEPVKTSKGSTKIDFVLTAKQIIELIKGYKDGRLDDMEIVSIAAPTTLPHATSFRIAGKDVWVRLFPHLEQSYKEHRKMKRKHKPTD